MNTVMGIDPGSNYCGWCVYVGEYKDGGCIRLKGGRTERLTQLGKSLDALFGEWQPSIVGIESSFVKTNIQAAIKLGQVQGIVVGAAIRVGATWVDVAPTTAKRALTGSGKATKEQMQQFARMILGVDVDEHHADAMGVAEAAIDKVTERVLAECRA